MTLTAPDCPVTKSLTKDVEARARGIPGVTEVKAAVAFDPPWGVLSISETARLQLGMWQP